MIMPRNKYTTYMSPQLLPPELADRRNFVVRHIAPLLREMDTGIAHAHYAIHLSGAESGGIEWVDDRKVHVPLDRMMDLPDMLAAYLRAAGFRLI